MPKFIVDIYAEGENDQWYMYFMEDQLNISAGSVSIKKIDQKDIEEKKYAIRLLQSCVSMQEGILKTNYMREAIDTLEKNNA